MEIINKKIVTLGELCELARERSFTGEEYYKQTRRTIFIGYYNMPSYYGDPQDYEPDQEDFYSIMFRINRRDGFIESYELEEYDGCYLKKEDR